MSDKKSSCGLLNAVFGRRGFWPRRTASSASLASANPNNDFHKTASNPNSKRRRGSSDESTFIQVPVVESKPASKVGQQRAVYINHQQRGVPMSNQNEGCKIAAPPSRVTAAAGNGYVDKGRRVPKEAIGISGELELMIADHQKSKGTNGSLVRASSSNVMLFGNLGNCHQHHILASLNFSKRICLLVIGRSWVHIFFMLNGKFDRATASKLSKVLNKLLTFKSRSNKPLNFVSNTCLNFKFCI